MLTTLSQGHLSLLETCPRKFQHTYIDQLSGPVDPDIQARQRWGSQFHLLMQQREMGLPVESLPPGDGELQACIRALVAAAPDLFSSHPQGSRQSEYPRTLAFNGYLLTAVYDLLVVQPGSGKIVDWKTYPRPRAAPQLAQDWQTRLYLFLLVETTGLTPAQVSMDYWFVRCQNPETGELLPHSATIAYSAARHAQTRADLHRLTDQLTHLLAQPRALPKVDAARGICQGCPFAYRCDRLATSSDVLLPPLSAVEEVPLPS